MKDRIRIFISYSHDDVRVVNEITEFMQREERLWPVFDAHLPAGQPFRRQIKRFIEHAHVFAPVVTKTSIRAGWVHQEIGYAVALHIPVMPIALGGLPPGQFIAGIQAIALSENRGEWGAQLNANTFERLVRSYQDSTLAQFYCAESLEERTLMLVNLANEATNLWPAPSFGTVRQKAALSSFHIPDKVVSHPVWRDRIGDVPRTPYQNRLMRKERIALEKHARGAGCKLIVDPCLTFENFSKDPETCARIKKVRLQALLDFLKSFDDDLVEIAVSPRLKEHDNVTIVGDWFYAESITPSAETGYRQTVYTKHAPSILEKIDEFDKEFREYRPNGPEPSRHAAMNLIEEILNGHQDKCHELRAKAGGLL